MYTALDVSRLCYYTVFTGRKTYQQSEITKGNSIFMG